ncbi:MAG TPA: DUF4129 domain-containing protein, partial [Gammaproteobacteria bacterium]|nr:DUF4129 domain-containing protein [Gammaproteobacteria bacterium]
GAGLPRAPHEGPRDYGARVARERPELAPVMTTVVEAYVRLRYGRGTRDGDLRLLRAAVRRLKP